MASSSASLRRIFLSWERPLLAQAVEWLAQGWDGAGPLDLSRVLVMVPTQQAGRRLREALAGHAAERGQAVFPPRVLTPEALAGQDLGPDVASRPDALLAWTEVLRAMEFDAFRAVFPVDPPARNFAWALRLAQQFVRLQITLAENGVTMADVGARAAPGFVEAERWNQLAELERRQAQRLKERGLLDPQAARIAAVKRNETSDTISRVVLLAVPDPHPLALKRLATVTGKSGIEVVVFAPEGEAGVFDAWGRPVPAAWEKREIALPDFEARVHLCADPATQAARVAAMVAGYQEPDAVLGIGIADPEVTPLVENELARAGRPTFNPEGQAFAREALFELLSCLAALAREPLFGHAAALARCPEFFGYLRAELGAGFSVAHWLDQMDELGTKHLPAGLGLAQQFAAASKHLGMAAQGLAVMVEIQRELAEGGFATAAASVLGRIFSKRQLDFGREEDVRLHTAAAAWMEVLRDCAEAEARFGALPPAEAWDLALRLFAEQRRTEDKPAGAIELQGWLEMLWEDAPHLVVAGCNDGRVPEAMAEDAFLPDSLRKKLGLRTNAARFARDAYLLAAIAASRAEGGRLDLVYGKTSSVGEPLRPSRLLLRCRDEELPVRIAFLFRPVEIAEANAPWTRTWKLTPRIAAPPEKVAVTSLRRYLRCPFRFYLAYVLKMEGVDPVKSELDAFDFGTLCHFALERLGTDAVLRDCTDPAVLRTELLQRLDDEVRKRYGSHLSLPQLVQVESARQRVGKLAELQAAERAAGWEIVEVERPFEIEVAGLKIRGKIDRIDRHAATGAVRVLDYKTSDKPVSPAEAHLVWLRSGDDAPPDWARYDGGDRPQAWIDLQLPLYCHALSAIYPTLSACGYFNLPKASGETTLAIWEGYSPELHEAAMRCAKGVCEAIRAGKFWPPNETVRAEWDEFAPLFHHGVAESIEWEQFEAATKLAAEAGKANESGHKAPSTG